MMDTIYSILGAILPLEAYQYSFMKNAFLAILLLTPLLGLLGTMAVNHQMAFFSDALGHSALTGIGLGIILGLRNDLVAMLVFGIIWAILICVIKQSGSASTDTVISVFSSTSVAAGLLILARGGKFAKYSSLLIGDVLAVTPSDLLWLLLAFIGTLILTKCGQRNMQSLSEAMHGADGEHLQQVYGDFDNGDAMYEPYGDDQQMTKMRISFLALDRINKLQRFDCLVAQAAGQDMNNYEMPEYDAKNVDYSQDLVDAIGRDFEDIVRANPDAYGPQ